MISRKTVAATARARTTASMVGRNSSVLAAAKPQRVIASACTLKDLRRPQPVDLHNHQEKKVRPSNGSSTITSGRTRNGVPLPDHIAELVKEYTKKQPTSVPLQTLLKTGRGEYLGETYKKEVLLGQLDRSSATERILLQVARFLHSELPIRLAYRIQNLDTVPLLCDMPSTQVVKEIYTQSFFELVHFPHQRIQTSDEEEAFAQLLQRLFRKHSDILTQMARGAFELREAIATTSGGGIQKTQKFLQYSDCNKFLDRFFLSRIGTRVLVGHYLSLRSGPLEDYIGLFCLKTSTYDITRQAIEDATMMCERKYNDSPRVVLSGRLDLTFPYVPTYLHYILLELLKNAMVATMEHHQNTKKEVPHITVIIADSTENEDVVIKIMDEGGGIPRSQLETKIWSYLFTTTCKSVQQSVFQKDATLYADHHNSSPISGLGFGLPISRSYARYFGGDLDIMSMEGYGTDAYVHLKRIGDCKEPLMV